MPLVFLTSLFVGGVAALQSAYQFQGAVPLIYVGTVIAKSVFIELGPVLTALVVGARVGASFAAEIGTMRVTEQIDALETLAIRPVRFLAVPRFVGRRLHAPRDHGLRQRDRDPRRDGVAVTRVGISVHTFTRGMQILFDPHDIYGGLIKSFVFGGSHRALRAATSDSAPRGGGGGRRRDHEGGRGELRHDPGGRLLPGGGHLPHPVRAD